jgi:pSer/pThr/pTyr-binding forkhead associated (FHA) protein
VGENTICTLIVFSKSGGVSHVPLDGKSVVIGRSAECHLRLDHRSVSRRHARLFLTGSDWILSDLRSTNGTIVNGSRISNRWLQSGDFIRIGAFGLRFGSEPVSATPETADSDSGVKDAVRAGTSYEPASADRMQVDLRNYYEEFPNARLESDYPRIWNEISRRWGAADCEPYLHQLIHTERIGRQGFPLHIMSELLCLLHVHPREAGSPSL